MNIETLISILTAAAALITSAVSFYFSFMQNRKDRIQKVILENRIKYMYEIREGFTNFIGLANIGAINTIKKSSEAQKAFYANLFYGYGKIVTYIKPFYDIDRELLKSLDNLYDYILKVINGDEQNTDKIAELREDFADKYLKYDWAYWKYIQQQKYGKYMNSDDEFDNVYNDFVSKLEKNKENKS